VDMVAANCERLRLQPTVTRLNCPVLGVYLKVGLPGYRKSPEIGYGRPQIALKP